MYSRTAEGRPARRQPTAPTAGRGLRLAGRAGFTARGVVYVLVGLLALRIAAGDGSDEADRQGALRQVAEQPFGEAALWLLVAGFAGMALWRASTAVLGRGGDHKAAKRLLNAGRALFYAAVCWGTAAFAAGAGGESDGDGKSRTWTAHALGLPTGRVLVTVAGLVVAGVGVGTAVQALRRRFLRKLSTGRMGHRTRTAVTIVGMAGNTARGTVFTAAGVFLVTAAVRFDPQRAKGLDDTLRSLADTAAGPSLLAAVAFGLLLFGIFSFLSARWRSFD
ncbi:protein of unknown function [Streptomyces sp. TLI_053]|uniref:DUF1206 domain-containing protein n=1 Tax=Streptomyces sp. TLI_053 TaxID=1855352 RepID=UPI00087C974F|nr:DUF1206 domain-containing protein [Streptomyces sp. TLI_053]SDT82798.1 protein of unknown function [Streptomyces sp. TLI_053]